VRLEGSLDAFSLPDIFALLSMTKKTGGLHLRRDNAHGVVWFTTGGLTGGASDVRREALARRLVGSGHVDDAALAAAVERCRAEEGLGFARVVQQANAVDEAVLHDVVSEHIVDTVFDLLRWPNGDFEFVVDEPNPDDVGVARQVDDVVTESRRRLDLWSAVAETVPSPKTVLAVVPNPSADPSMSRDEWALLSYVDGRRSVADVVTLAGRGEFAVVSALADLVNRGLLRLNDAGESSSIVQRQQLLAQLEGVALAEPAAEQVDLSGDEIETFEDIVMDERELGADDDADEFGDDDNDDRVAEVTMLPGAEHAVVPQQSGAREVSPKRPEPFLPGRQVDHPEEPMAALAGGGAAPVAASYIERDPSVNKSLLLRLIAGVRGL
jgi:hypothetical protein